MTNWTTTPPTEPGWYFHRFNDKCHAVARYVYSVGAGQLRVVEIGDKQHVSTGDAGGEWWPLELRALAFAERIQEPDND